MARVWIGNFKGPKGDKGDKGDIGPQGPEGKQGPVGLVNADAAIEFEDYITEGVEVPDPEEAFAEIVSGKSLKSIISNIRAFFKGAVTLGMIVNNLEDVLNVEEGTVLPVGCKAFQDLSAKIPIPRNELLAFSSQVEESMFKAYRVGSTVVFNMRLNAITKLNSSSKILTTKSPYKPLVYTTLSVRKASTPYAEIGTLWIAESGEGVFYGSIEANTMFYVSGSLVF